MTNNPPGMKMPAQGAHRSGVQPGLPPCRLRRRQQGVVLIIALILLVVISLLTVTALRNTGSSESLAGNVRTTELATEAADIALRYCEGKALAMATAHELSGSAVDQWKTPATWDAPWASNSTSMYVLAAALVNQTGMDFATYKRPPECMVEELPALTTGTATFYVITARGFGPEVAQADSARSRPVGSEVWLQSHIAFE